MERVLEQRSCNPFTHSREVRVAPSGRVFPRGVASAWQPIKGAPLPQREKVGEGADERSFGTGGYLQLAPDFHDPEGRAQESSWWKARPGRCEPRTAGALGRLLLGCRWPPCCLHHTLETNRLSAHTQPTQGCSSPLRGRARWRPTGQKRRKPRKLPILVTQAFPRCE